MGKILAGCTGAHATVDKGEADPEEFSAGIGGISAEEKENALPKLA
jgi:hypothetical protein